MATYSFPVLENDELLPCLEEMEVPLTAAQVAKPSYEIVRPLFETILINLTGITRYERAAGPCPTCEHRGCRHAWHAFPRMRAGSMFLPPPPALLPTSQHELNAGRS